VTGAYIVGLVLLYLHGVMVKKDVVVYFRMLWIACGLAVQLLRRQDDAERNGPSSI
jgi:hypothetical protein